MKRPAPPPPIREVYLPWGPLLILAAALAALAALGAGEAEWAPRWAAASSGGGWPLRPEVWISTLEKAAWFYTLMSLAGYLLGARAKAGTPLGQARALWAQLAATQALAGAWAAGTSWVVGRAAPAEVAAGAGWYSEWYGFGSRFLESGAFGARALETGGLGGSFPAAGVALGAGMAGSAYALACHPGAGAWPRLLGAAAAAGVLALCGAASAAEVALGRAWPTDCAAAAAGGLLSAHLARWHLLRTREGYLPGGAARRGRPALWEARLVGHCLGVMAGGWAIVAAWRAHLLGRPAWTLALVPAGVAVMLLLAKRGSDLHRACFPNREH